MFGISGTELFLILLFGFLIFGPDKLPEIAKTIGRGIAKFKSAQEDMNNTLQGQIFDPNSDEPFKDPVQALDKLAQKAEEKEKKPAATGAAAAAAATSATQQRATGAGNAVRQESFTERKARYERERAARRAEEERRAKEAQAAPAATAPAEQATGAQAQAGKAKAPATAADAKSTPESDVAATSERGE